MKYFLTIMVIISNFLESYKTNESYLNYM